MPSLTLGSLNLMAAPYDTLLGTDYGAWSAITSTTSSLFLDGSVVSGEATANRAIVVKVQASAGIRSALVAACEALIGEANKASNTLTFTPDGGAPPIVYEVFRSSAPARVDLEPDSVIRRTYQLTFPALPFARSATRQSPAALAPTVTIDAFEANFTGLAAVTPFADGSAARWEAPMGAAGTTLLAFLTGGTLNNSLTVVTNCTLTYPGGTQAIITTTANGLVEARSAAAWTVAGAVVTVAANIKATTGSGTRQYLVGVEWLDSGGASIRIDWGTQTGVEVSGNSFSVWAAAPAATGAVTCRLRVRVIGALSGEVYEVTDVAAHTSVLGTVVPDVGSVHDGVNGLSLPLGGTPATTWPNQAACYDYRALPAPVDVSTLALLKLWVKVNNSTIFANDPVVSRTGVISVRLWDAAGRWSRFAFTGQAFANSIWKQISATLATPYMSSAAGSVNLAAVTAYDVDVIAQVNSGSIYVDTLTAAPPAAVGTARGTVFALDPILGSARTTAAVTVSAGSPLTDWLVAAIGGTTGPPMVVVTTSVATVAAPAGYNGVFSVIGCIAPATVIAAPTCTVVQKNAGVTVATQVLTGTTRPGNHYVDFGAVSLPLVATPPENLGVSYTFTLGPANTNWVEVLVIDVDASLAWVDNMTTAMKQGWIDEPDIVAGLGKVWVGTATDRTDATALALPPTMSRPLQVKAPNTRLLVYSTTSAPNVALSYFPRWLVEPS